MADVLSFDFSNVTVTSGPSISDIPVDTPLYATLDKIELENFGGVDKFVFTQTVFIDPQDESKSTQFKTFIGPKHGWLLAQYLAAAGEDFRSLSGQGLSASALQSVLGGCPLSVIFKENKYTDKTGQERTSKQITTVRKLEE